MKVLLSLTVLISLLTGCSINIEHNKKEEKPTKEEVYEVLHTFLDVKDVGFDKNEEDIEKLQLVTCEFDMVNCRVVNNTFHYNEEDPLNISEFFTESRTENEELPYTNKNKRNELEIVFKMQTKEDSKDFRLVSSKEYTMDIEKGQKTIRIFNDRAVLVYWL